MEGPSLYPISGQCTRKYLFLPPDKPLLDSVFVRSFNVCLPSFHCESGDRREHDMNSKATRVSEEPGAAGLAGAGPFFASIKSLTEKLRTVRVLRRQFLKGTACLAMAMKTLLYLLSAHSRLLSRIHDFTNTHTTVVDRPLRNSEILIPKSQIKLLFSQTGLRGRSSTVTVDATCR